MVHVAFRLYYTIANGGLNLQVEKGLSWSVEAGKNVESPEGILVKRNKNI